MPFKSEKQRRFLWAEHPEIAKRWAHKYPESNKDLPMYASDKDDKSTAKEKTAQINISGLVRRLAIDSNFTVPSILDPETDPNVKIADSKQEKVDIPRSEKPTYAGEERAKGMISSSIDTGKNVNESCGENAINTLLQKISVVLSPAIEQTMENLEAEREGRVPRRVGKNRGLKQYPVATPQIPLPLGMQMASQPQQSKQSQPASPTPVGAGQSTATTDPIKFHSGLSMSGVINGNASLSAPNTVNTKISAAGEQSSSLLEAPPAWLRSLMGAGLFGRMGIRGGMLAGGLAGAGHGMFADPGEYIDDKGHRQKRTRLQKVVLDSLSGIGIGGLGGGVLGAAGGATVPLWPNKKEAAAGDFIQSWLMGMDHIEPDNMADILAEERVKSAVEKWADVVYAGNDAQVIKEHDEREKAIADWEKKWNMKWEDYVPSWERNKKPRVKKSASTPAWQRAAGKNDEGGLNAKGRASYNRETGGNLKAPVTEKNPKGERNKRQNSFCSRMCGMKRVNTGAKTKSDPDSRINKALRKWNCKCSAAENFGKEAAKRAITVAHNKTAVAGGARAIAHAAEGEGVDPTVAALAGLATLGGLYGVYHGGKKLLAPVARRLSVSTLPDDEINAVALPTNPKQPDQRYTFAERYRQPSLLGGLFIDSDEDAIANAITQVAKKNPSVLQRLEAQSASPADLDRVGKTLVTKYPHRYRLPEKAAAKRVLNLSPSWGGQKWQLGEWGLNPQVGYRYLGGVVPTPDIALRLGGPIGGTAVGLAPFPYIETDWGRPSGRQANKETRSLYKWIGDGFKDRPTAAAHALASVPEEGTADDYEAAMRSSGVGYSSKELKRLAERMAKMGPLRLPVEE